MELRGKRVLLCNCEASMPLDADRLVAACQANGASGKSLVNSQLCRAQLGNFQDAVASGAPVLVACTQEAPLFAEVAAESDPQARVSFVNIRERAGWSDAAGTATPKIAALIAEAALDIEPTPAMELISQGVCLVYGKGEQAIEAARQLSEHLDVTLLLESDDEALPPPVTDSPIFKGRIVAAKGHLGAFGVTVNDHAAANPSSRARLEFEAPRDNVFSECDLILDLSGGTPLFPAPETRDGYQRPDPGDPLAVQKAVMALSEMVGEYDKPQYIAFNADICAHGRSRKTGCIRCLDLCPTSAITSAGDHVAIDPLVCAGCGSCASVCPTGAATYQLPGGDSLFDRLRTLLGAYAKAGGEGAVLLLHDERHGGEMISIMARLGRGLPDRVLPFAVNEVTQVGIDFFAAAFAYGAAQVAILVGADKQGRLEGLAAQIGLAESVMDGLGYGGGRIHLLDQPDPTAVEAALYGLDAREAAPAGQFLALGGKRSRVMLALRHLHAESAAKPDHLMLAPGAPFGAVEIDTAGCTLCLACVSACPTAALHDDPERPLVAFSEEACVQCGLCKNTCPESVISLVPRLNFTEAARGAQILNESEPFNCIRCGTAFGVKQSIERIAEQLAGKHYMFAEQEQIDRIKMCEDCRISVQFERGDNPFAGKDRPRMHTTDDDLREREIEEARAKLLKERAEEAGKNGEG